MSFEEAQHKAPSAQTSCEIASRQNTQTNPSCHRFTEHEADPSRDLRNREFFSRSSALPAAITRQSDNQTMVPGGCKRRLLYEPRAGSTSTDDGDDGPRILKFTRGSRQSLEFPELRARIPANRAISPPLWFCNSRHVRHLPSTIMSIKASITNKNPSTPQLDCALDLGSMTIVIFTCDSPSLLSFPSPLHPRVRNNK